MTSFTKGKWFHCWYNTKVGKHKCIEVVAGVKVSEGAIKSITKVSGTNVEAQANARLIAEAPVMYDLLNKAFHILGKNTANDAICREIDECLSRVDGAPIQSEKGK